MKTALDDYFGYDGFEENEENEKYEDLLENSIPMDKFGWFYKVPYYVPMYSLVIMPHIPA